MLEALTLVLFAAACLYGVVRPIWTVAMIVLLFPMEQLMQAAAPSLRATPLGNQAVNYIVGLVGLASMGSTILQRPDPFRGLLNGATVAVTLILIWATLTIAWSLDRTGAIDMTSLSWPYYFLRIVIGSFLLLSVEDLDRLWRYMMVLACALCILILTNPAFTSQYGRLGFVEGSKMRSNPLALGDLGAIALMLGGLLRRTGGGRLFAILRPVSVAVGTIMAIQSGARGQLFLAALTTLAFFPVAAPLKSVRAFILTLTGLAAFAVLVPVLMSFLLEGFAAQRFSLESLLYGSSSASERVANVRLLFEAFLRRPGSILTGLGYFSFNSLGGGTVYSHVIIADFIFELGLPGIAGLVTIIWVSATSSISLYRRWMLHPVLRTSTATLLAFLVFFLLLANKQGDLWGSTVLFMFMCMAGRLHARRELEDVHEEEVPPDAPEVATP